MCRRDNAALESPLDEGILNCTALNRPYYSWGKRSVIKRKEACVFIVRFPVTFLQNTARHFSLSQDKPISQRRIGYTLGGKNKWSNLARATT